MPASVNPLVYPSKSARTTYICGAIILAAWTIFYLGCQGMPGLLGKTQAFDLRLRWLDEQYFLRGQNPYDVASGRLPFDPAIGRPVAGGYPPWSFISGLIFTSVPWGVQQALFAFYDITALGVIAWFGYQKGKKYGFAAAALLAAAGPCIAGNLPAIAWGQYGLIVVALLLGAAMLEEAGAPILAGVLLGVALLKPNISAPFCICYLVQKRFKVLSVAAVYIVLACAAVWAVTKTNPIEMCQQMLHSSEAWAGDVPSVLRLAVLMHVPIHIAIPLVAGVIVTAGALLMFLARHRSLLVQYSIACMTAMLWTYHRRTDDIMMLPMIVAVGILLFEFGGSFFAILFLAVGLSLWLPFSNHQKTLLVSVQCVIWVIALIVVLIKPQETPSDANSIQTPAGPEPDKDQGGVAAL